MHPYLTHFPPLIVSAALVAVFVSLLRRNRSPHALCWLVAWGLMLLHRILHLQVHEAPLWQFVRLGSLQMAGIVFLTSVSAVGCVRRQSAWGMGWLGVPVLAYTALVSWQVPANWAGAVCLLFFFFAGLTWRLRRNADPLMPVSVALLVAAFGIWVVYRLLQGNAEVAEPSVLLVLYCVCGVLFVRQFPRATAGAAATAIGFFIWAAVCALSLWAPALVRAVGVQSDLWNVPRLFVAFGMILVLLEKESLEAQAAGAREHAANVQLQRFAEVTSHLLSGVEVKSYCGRIAEVITEATTFVHVVVALLDADQQFSVGGYAGLTETELAQVQASIAKLNVGSAENLFQQGLLIGKTAVIASPEQLQAFDPLAATREYEPNPYWRGGNRVLVPLRSPRGALVGFISLADPAQPEHVNTAEMSKIEMLAADMAVAIDNAALRRQLVNSEKLAGLGQLVGGVAHEINNPLTAVLGYAELLTEQAATDEMRRGLGIIHREAQRIHGILSNLLRFAQQDAAHRKSIEVLPLLKSVLRQVASEAPKRGIELVDTLPPEMPKVVVDESQLRQVFLHVLHNAFEAVDKVEEKRVTITARAENHRLMFSVLDTGPGFSEVTRVFDPFFTTKSPGKGPGLGLSICFGVLKQHGGNITARNLEPSGACITIELPVAWPEPARITAVSAENA